MSDAQRRLCREREKLKLCAWPWISRCACVKEDNEAHAAHLRLGYGDETEECGCPKGRCHCVMQFIREKEPMNDPIIPEPAEVGLDLHMLRHEALEAAKTLQRNWGAGLMPQSWRESAAFDAAIQRLIAGEDEYAKILAAEGANVEPPENSESEERPADNSPAYRQKRCYDLAAKLRDASMNITVAQDDSEAQVFKKLLWDASYWLDRMANRA